MVVSLAPVLFAFYVFAPQSPVTTPGHPAVGILGAALIFGGVYHFFKRMSLSNAPLGMALSRIGLWSFDLIQTKQLQTALTTHPKRNTLTALQYTMQNIASLIKCVLSTSNHLRKLSDRGVDSR
jgi:solute carrier family 40 (iron-regulated transporter), member 1